MKNFRYRKLPREEQILKIEQIIKFLKWFSICWSVFLVVGSILICTFTPSLELGIALLVAGPLTIYFGYFVQVAYLRKEIKQLKDQCEDKNA